MPKILVINGPNLNMLGIREKEIYGGQTLADINSSLEELALQEGVDIEFFQSNHEGEIVDRIHRAYGKVDFMIINAGAYTHYSVAIYDALKTARIPFIEVHISNIYARESFRHRSLLSPLAAGGIFGFGPEGYRLALAGACRLLRSDTQ